MAGAHEVQAKAVSKVDVMREETMAKIRFLKRARCGCVIAAATAGLLVAASAFAQEPVVSTTGPLPITDVELDHVQWTRVPFTPVESAMLVGRGSEPGLYIQLVRWPPHTSLKAHSHPDDRYAIVLKGTFYHGFSDRFDEAKLEKRPSGTFFTEPKGVRHFGATRDEGTVLMFVGTGPTAIVDPEK